jgi:hypothetical protein
LYIKIKENKFLFIIKILGGKNMGINSKEIIENKKLEEILKMVEEVKYGSITLIIQDGVIIQVDKNEKIRMK